MPVKEARWKSRAPGVAKFTRALGFFLCRAALTPLLLFRVQKYVGLQPQV